MGSVKWTILEGLSLMLRSSVDYYHDSGEFKLYNDTLWGEHRTAIIC